MHACYCKSEICTGTMHHAAINFDLWEKLVKKEFGHCYNELPGKYGDQLLPLKIYPESIRQDKINIYEFSLFGSETKPAEKYVDKILPTVSELRRRIRETGKQLSFTKLKMTVYGIRDDILLVKRMNS